MKVMIEKLQDEDAFEALKKSKIPFSPVSITKLTDCLKASEFSWKGTIDGKMVCIWGLVPPTLMSEQAYLWSLSTPDVEKHIFIFVRYSQLVIAEILKKYPVIVGHTFTTEPRSIRWLRWLGAEFEPGVGRIAFVIRRKDG